MSAESSGPGGIPADGPAGDPHRDVTSPSTPTSPVRDNRLEGAYGRLLLAYPRHWRAEHEAALLATLLDAAEADGRGRPTLAEAADLVGNGLATRARPVIGWIPARARLAVATVALAAGGVLSAVMLTVAEQGPGPVWPFAPPDQPLSGARAPVGLGPLETDGLVVYLPWLVAFGAAALGLRRVARIAAVAVLPATAAVLTLSSVSRVQRPPLALLATLCLLALVVAVVWTAPAAPGRAEYRRPLAVTTLLITGWIPVVVLFYRVARLAGDLPTRQMVTGGYFHVYSLYYDLSESLPSAFLVAGLAMVVLSVFRPGWLAAFSVTGVAVSPLGFSRIRAYDDAAADHALMLGLFVFILVLLGVFDLQRAARRQAHHTTSTAAD
ncbi:hypothetical protein I6A60_02895 [Frankia sp. AgB1.9]|uniref:hypothetical protein n=1 Tax=unclassified Frankia TaxID=2632575 RepID=UPI001932F8C6|nr:MULTISPECIES: hypothetical protein [unclassified Frankia]MBL7489000.1 hypothetical protein [Frankia sp. AgW1.1]MBL7546830.1 hypothetical protein [Frankia sp. AgB1.9]MBL7624018.1 hypothetical protein [Frankia sp. AgB1.8]